MYSSYAEELYPTLYGVHIGATWRILLNRLFAAAMRSYVTLLWPFVIISILCWLSGEALAWLSVWSDVQIICLFSSWCHCSPIILLQ